MDINELVNKAAERDLSDPSALGDYFEAECLDFLRKKG